MTQRSGSMSQLCLTAFTMDGLCLTNIVLTSKIAEATDHLLRGGSEDESFNKELIRIRNQWRNKLSGGEAERAPLVIPFKVLQSIQKALVKSPLEEGKAMYLHELIEGSDLFFCEPPKPERNPELEARLARLRQEAEEREYQRMVKNVATELRYSNEEQLRIDMQSTKRQLVVVCNFIITVAAAFIFGYYCGKWFFSGDFLTCMMSGLALGTAVLYADLYFILKKPEVLEVEEAKSQRESEGGGRATVKISSSPVGT